MRDYFATTPDPDRGWALAALTGGLSFTDAKPAVLRDLVDDARRSGAVLRWSYDYVGDLGRDHRADLAAAIRRQAASRRSAKWSRPWPNAPQADAAAR